MKTTLSPIAVDTRESVKAKVIDYITEKQINSE